MKKLILILPFILLFASCGAPDSSVVKEENSKKKETSNTLSDDHPHVHALVLQKTDFPLQLLSQGEVLTKEKVDVSLPAGIIEKVIVSRGQRVRKGDILARMKDDKWQQEYALLTAEMEEKELQREAKLISLGYASDNGAPEDLLRKINIELGIPALQLRQKHKKTELAEKKILAPISGIVTDLEAQSGNPASNYKKLCTLVNDRNLEIKFPILEGELIQVKKGMGIQLTPFYREQISSAKVSSMDPVVDEHGMVWVYADITRNGSPLLEGMKVRVVINNLIPDQRVLPKSAILDRQDRYVIFVYKGGKAHWVYGYIDQENSTHYTLKDEGPQWGDTVIISNNFDLSHLQPVVIDSLFTSN